MTTIHNQNTNIANDASPSLDSVIRKFGGKKSLVARRTEKLEKLWAADRAITHVKKTKWQASAGQGNYKKKMTLDFKDPKDKHCNTTAGSKKQYRLA